MVYIGSSFFRKKYTCYNEGDDIMLTQLLLHVYGIIAIGSCILAGGVLVLWLDKK